MSGRELVQRKVKVLICMGGEYPKGKEWNFSRDPESTRYVLENWPTGIVFSGYELGAKVLTGQGLKNLEQDNPVRRAYELHNSLKGRPSWDQITVLYGVRGITGQLRSVFSESSPGENLPSADGSNLWRAGSGSQSYLQRNVSPEVIGRMVEELMSSSQKKR